MEDEQWIDVGEKAHWWGGTANECTCQTRPMAKPTRIDGILASRDAIARIKHFCVEGSEMIPTHKVLKLSLTQGEPMEERTYAKILVSLTKLFEKNSTK